MSTAYEIMWGPRVVPVCLLSLLPIFKEMKKITANEEPIHCTLVRNDKSLVTKN